MCARQALYHPQPFPSLSENNHENHFPQQQPCSGHGPPYSGSRGPSLFSIQRGAGRCSEVSQVASRPALETRSSDTRHSAGRTENGTEEKDQTRPHSSKTALLYMTSFTTVFVSDLTLRTTGLCREEQWRSQERGWAVLRGRPGIFFPGDFQDGA